MAKENINSKKGFTIIEVVLVLAIAGLIFLMVFIALPALQRSQRDTQRRDDYAALSTAVTTYMTNNNGALPINTAADGQCTANFTATQINANGQDPNGRAYDLRCTTNRNTATNGIAGAMANGASPIVYIVRNARCNNGALAAGTGNRSFAIYGQLESGTYCQSST